MAALLRDTNAELTPRMPRTTVPVIVAFELCTSMADDALIRSNSESTNVKLQRFASSAMHVPPDTRRSETVTVALTKESTLSNASQLPFVTVTLRTIASLAALACSHSKRLVRSNTLF
jgi:hypothetical protein